MNASRVGGAVLGLVALVIFGLIVGAHAAIQATATDVRGDVGLWLYDSDVSYGMTFDALVRADSIAPVTISSVEVRGEGFSQRFRGEGDDDLDIEVKVPASARGAIDLVIDVSYSQYGDNEHAIFWKTVHVRGPLESDIWRAGKALLAIASWLALCVFDLLRRREYACRYTMPGPGWIIAVVPVGFIGWCWFTELLEHVTRLHGWWFAAMSMALCR